MHTYVYMADTEMRLIIFFAAKDGEAVYSEQKQNQEMTRVNIDIVGISELRWTGIGEFNSDDHYIYYCGQESLRRNGVAIIVNKESKVQYLDAISKTPE